ETVSTEADSRESDAVSGPMSETGSMPELDAPSSAKRRKRDRRGKDGEASPADDLSTPERPVEDSPAAATEVAPPVAAVPMSRRQRRLQKKQHRLEARAAAAAQSAQAEALK